MSDRETLTRLEQELKAVRATSRRDRIIFGVIASVIGAFVIGGAGQPAQVVDEIRAKRLTIVDANGTVRAQIATDEFSSGLSVYNDKGEGRAFVQVSAKGEPSIEITDGKQHGMLKAYQEGPCLTLTGANGKIRGTFGLHSEKGPALFLSDSNGNRKLTAALSGDNAGGISFAGDNNRDRFNLYARSDGSGTFLLQNPKGGKAFLEVSNTGEPRVEVSDGDQVAQMKAHKEGPAFSLADSSGKLHGSLCYGADTGPSLFFVDKAGEPRLQIGMDQQANGAVAFQGEKGQQVFSLSARTDGSGSLVFMDSSNKMRFTAGIGGSGTPRLDLRDENATVLALLSARKNGRTSLDMFDTNGKKRAVMGVEGDIPSFQFWDQSEKIRGSFGMIRDLGNPLAPPVCTMTILDEKEALVWKVPAPK